MHYNIRSILSCVLSTIVQSVTLRKAVHWTDVHVDPLYTVGSDSKSNYCMSGKGDAGTFGHSEGNCATPISLYEGAVDFLVGQNVDMVLFTGDFTQAGLTSLLDVVSVIDYDLLRLRNQLPEAKVFACVGNHDAYPGDVFPYPFPALYEFLVTLWGKDLQSTAKQQLRQGGYYSTAADQGLQIIALNSMYLTTLNPLVKNVSSAAYKQGFVQMEWFATELAAAEKRGDRVWVLAHVPFDDGFVPAHVTRYQQLMDEYKNVVTGQFYGHDHVDFFKITRSCDASGCRGEPTGTLFVGPSLTEGYPPENPGVRMYLYDGNHTVQDAITYRVNLTKANLEEKLDFEYEYSMKDAYNLTDLSPISMAAAVEHLSYSQKAFDRFYKYYHRGYDGPSLPTCDPACWLALVCKLAFLDAADVKTCAGDVMVDSYSAIYCHPDGAAVAAEDPVCVAPVSETVV